MVTAFRAERIGGMMWPELAGVGLVMGGHVAVRGVDAALAWDRPFRRVSDYAHLATLFGSAYCVATDRAVDTMKAIFFANSGILATAAGDAFYQRAVGKRVAMIRARKIAERQISTGQKAGAGAGAGNPQLAAAERQAILEAARLKAGQNIPAQRMTDDTKRGTIRTG